MGRHCIRVPHRMAHGAIRRGIWYCTGCTVSHTPSVLAPGQLRHLKGTTQSCSSSLAQYERARGGKGRGARRQTPPQAVTHLNPFGASRATTPQATPARLLQKYKIGPRHSSFCSDLQDVNQIDPGRGGKGRLAVDHEARLTAQDMLSQDEPAMKRIPQNNVVSIAIAGTVLVPCMTDWSMNE